VTGFRLLRCDVAGEAQPVWLFSFPGCGERPIAIADGNLRELLRDYVTQGGTIPIADDLSEPTAERQGTLFHA
jgi:hypothetical protein